MRRNIIFQEKVKYITKKIKLMRVIAKQQPVDEKKNRKHKLYFKKISQYFKVLNAKKYLSYIAIFLLLTAVFLSFSILSSIEVIQTLVEVIATIVSIFMALAIYTLGSFNNRLDNLRGKIEYYTRRIEIDKEYLINNEKKMKYQLKLDEMNHAGCKSRYDKILARKQKISRIVRRTAVSLFIAFAASFYLLNLVYLDVADVHRSFILNPPIYMKQFMALITLLSLSIGIIYLILLLIVATTQEKAVNIYSQTIIASVEK